MVLALDAADDPGVVWRPPDPSGVPRIHSCSQQETSARSHPGARQLWAWLGVFTFTSRQVFVGWAKARAPNFLTTQSLVRRAHALIAAIRAEPEAVRRALKRTA